MIATNGMGLCLWSAGARPPTPTRQVDLRVGSRQALDGQKLALHVARDGQLLHDRLWLDGAVEVGEKLLGVGVLGCRGAYRGGRLKLDLKLGGGDEGEGGRRAS